MKKFLLVLSILICMVSCSTTKQIEQSIMTDTIYINRTQTEYVQRIDSVYEQDSIVTNFKASGDTIFCETIKYKTKVIKAYQNANMSQIKDSIRTKTEYVYKDKVIYKDKPFLQTIKDNVTYMIIGVIIFIIVFLVIKFRTTISNIIGEICFSLFKH